MEHPFLLNSNWERKIKIKVCVRETGRERRRMKEREEIKENRKIDIEEEKQRRLFKSFQILLIINSQIIH